MTLNTAIRFTEPVDPEQVFGFMKQAIGIPAEREMTAKPSGYYEGAMEVRSTPGGYNAALDMTVNPAGVTRCGDKWHAENTHWRTEGDEDDVETTDPELCYQTGERFFVEVRLDTTYGFEPCCACLHMGLINQLHAQFPQPLTWMDEFSGTWHTRIPDACKGHGGELEWGY